MKGSRVRLNTLVTAFKQGDTPSQIAEDFPSVSVEQITAVIDWYLNHQTEAEQYFEWYDMEAERVRWEIESQPGYAARREELLRRRAQLLKT